jgi:hypothetical protein
LREAEARAATDDGAVARSGASAQSHRTPSD